MRALVTGGAGFIGRHLVGRLLDAGYEVTVIDSGETGRPDLLGEAVHLMHHDVATISMSEWVECLQDVDLVFHLAAKKYNTPGVSARDLLATNVDATWSLASACCIAGVRRIVFSSSLYAYGNLGPQAMRESDVLVPKTLYGASKAMGEYMLRTLGDTHGLSWQVARLFFAFGPGQFAEGGYKSVIVRNFERIAAGLAPQVCGSGNQSLDYVYVGDVVTALMSLANAQDSGLVVNVCSGKATSVMDLTRQLISISGASLGIDIIKADWTEGTSRFGDPSVSRRVLGWKPDVTLEEGLRMTWSDITGQPATSMQG